MAARCLVAFSVFFNSYNILLYRMIVFSTLGPVCFAFKIEKYNMWMWVRTIIPHTKNISPSIIRPSLSLIQYPKGQSMRDIFSQQWASLLLPPAIFIQTYDPFFIISNKICLLLLLHYPSHSGLLHKTTLIGRYQLSAMPGTIIQPLDHARSLISSIVRHLPSHLQPEIRKTRATNSGLFGVLYLNWFYQDMDIVLIVPFYLVFYYYYLKHLLIHLCRQLQFGVVFLFCFFF